MAFDKQIELSRSFLLTMPSEDGNGKRTIGLEMRFRKMKNDKPVVANEWELFSSKLGSLPKKGTFLFKLGKDENGEGTSHAQFFISKVLASGTSLPLFELVGITQDKRGTGYNGDGWFNQSHTDGSGNDHPIKWQMEGSTCTAVKLWQ